MLSTFYHDLILKGGGLTKLIIWTSLHKKTMGHSILHPKKKKKKNQITMKLSCVPFDRGRSLLLTAEPVGAIILCSFLALW